MLNTHTKHSLTLASVSMLRMFGFFLLMPILSYLASKLTDSTPLKIGLVMGIYGLVQAFFYFPLGILSDKIGRKPLIYFGLACMCLGSIIAANTQNINIMILARAIQGVGAISSVLSAFAADIIPEEFRTKSMMIIGIGVGISFPLSLIISPILYNNFGQSGIFYTITICSILALPSIISLPNIKPQPYIKNTQNSKNHSSILSILRIIIQDKSIKPWLVGVIFLHALSMMFFYIISFLLEEKGIILAKQWVFYLPILALSFIFSAKLVRGLEKKHRFSQISYLSIALIGISSLGLIFNQSLAFSLFSILVLVYFIGFNMLEMFQPSIISKLAQPNLKGATMGVYYTLQSIGMFIGSISAGYASKFAINHHFSKSGLIFSLSLSFVVIWCLYSYANSNNIK
ncbi:MAG: transporter, major facilitator family [Pseudomonadota bacterium]|jgi:predicted MFS family arabinose efflux permease